MTTYYRGRRRWRRPATDFPDRKHAANLADMVHAARLEAEQTDRRFFEELLGGDNAESKGPQDPDPAS